MRPQLPAEPRNDVDRIRASWIRQLLKCVAYAMETPRGDGTTTRREGDAICAIRGAGGGAGGKNRYSGFFILRPSDDRKKVRVVDGTELLGAGVCGVFVAGVDKVNVAEAELSVGADCYVVCRAQWERSASPQWTATLATVTAFPTPSETVFEEVVGFVKWDSAQGRISEIVQIWNSGVLYCNRYV